MRGGKTKRCCACGVANKFNARRSIVNRKGCELARTSNGGSGKKTAVLECLRSTVLDSVKETQRCLPSFLLICFSTVASAAARRGPIRVCKSESSKLLFTKEGAGGTWDGLHERGAGHQSISLLYLDQFVSADRPTDRERGSFAFVL